MPKSYKTDEFNVPQFPYHAFDVTASDVTVYDNTSGYSGGISVMTKTAGNLTLTPLGGGSDIVLTSVPAFIVIPFRVSAVKAASTAAVVGLS